MFKHIMSFTHLYTVTLLGALPSLKHIYFVSLFLFDSVHISRMFTLLKTVNIIVQ